MPEPSDRRRLTAAAAVPARTAAAAMIMIKKKVGNVEPAGCAEGTPAPIFNAAGLTPGTLDEDPKPFSEWTEEGFCDAPPPPGPPPRLPAGNTGAALRRALFSGIW